MMDMGRARLGITVADRLRRNMKMTSTTSPRVMARVTLTSFREAWIDSDRSNSTCSDTDAGRVPSNSGKRARTARTTATVLVPGWRWMARITERASLNQAAVLSFWTLSSTWPSSSSRTGRPPR